MYWYGLVAVGDDRLPSSDDVAAEADATNMEEGDEEKRPVEAALNDALERVAFEPIVTVEVTEARTTVRVMVEVDVMVMVVVAEVVRDAAAEDDWAVARGARSMRRARRNCSGERIVGVE